MQCFCTVGLTSAACHCYYQITRLHQLHSDLYLHSCTSVCSLIYTAEHGNDSWKWTAYNSNTFKMYIYRGILRHGDEPWHKFPQKCGWWTMQFQFFSPNSQTFWNIYKSHSQASLHISLCGLARLMFVLWEDRLMGSKGGADCSPDFSTCWEPL